MLNELYELAVALQQHGLLQSTTHPSIGTVGKAMCMLIELDRSGTVRAIRFLQKDETSRLWKHSKGNHNSFPAIRIQKPLLSIDESEKIDDATWKKAPLPIKKSLLFSLCFDKLNSAELSLYISEWSIKELEPVLLSDSNELAAFRQLISCFPKSKEAARFGNNIVLFLKEFMNTCDDEKYIDFIKALLVGTWDKTTKQYVAGCMTYYDVYETSSFSNKVIDQDTVRALITLLNQQNLTEKQPLQSLRGVLSGKIQEGVGEKYPNPNIPTLGLTYLYSKKSDVSCLTRYRMSGTEAFQAGKSEVTMINNAVAFLTAKSRENKSWKPMTNSDGDKPNLLLAYLTDDPQNNAFLADCLSAPTDFDEVEAAFDALCQQVLGNIKNLSDKNPQAKINLIILETLDPGRKQVVYGNSLSISRFCDNLIAWSSESQNGPPISIRVKDKTGIRVYNPICPGPNEILQIMKLHYTRSGSAKPLKQSAVSLHEVYRLYMPRSEAEYRDVDLLSNIIQKSVWKAHGLLGDIGQQIIVQFPYPLNASESFSKQVKNLCMFVSLISILLWRLGARKEKYMLEAPFNVGQFLKLADMLHKQYCVQVRNGGNEKKPLPTQLMGNEMLAIASENPVEGVIRLRDRMKVYLAWADTSTGEGAGLAKWILARFSEVSLKISEKGLPETFSAAEQAQVLLGYLAAIPYEKKEDENHD